MEKPSAIPLESLHGRKEDVGKTIRLTLSGGAFREFSLNPQQGDVRAAFVPLARLQRELDRGRKGQYHSGGGRVLHGQIQGSLFARGPRHQATPFGKQQALSLETDSALIPDALAERAIATAQSLGLRTEPVLTYLANSIRANGREIPYSVVTALDSAPAPAERDGITLNQWAARS